MSHPAFFDTFNAKYLTFREIAETFVFNHQFGDLTKNENTLLMGPRGSGKTTMLKMLTPMGLRHWQGHEAETIKARMPYTAIYIPTDIQWKRQLEQISSDLEKYPQFGDVVTKVLVTTNILLSVVSTFRSLLEFTSSEQPGLLDHEVRVARNLISSWQIENAKSPTFLGIEMGLIERVAVIRNHANRVLHTTKSESEIVYPNYYFDDFMEKVRFACIAFQNEFALSKSSLANINRWALCFDELEIAPRWLQLDLLNLLRGRDSNILFKLTTSPIVSLYDETSKEYSKVEAQENNDFKVVRMWLHSLAERKSWTEFSEKLISEKLRRNYGDDLTAFELFGKSDIERAVLQELDVSGKASINKNSEVYGEGSIIWHLFKELAKANPSFKAFLNQKGIDPNNPIPMDDSQKNSVYRKVKQLAAYRYILQKQSKGRSQKRSRKVVPLYFGLPHLYEIADGNPRQLIGLFDDLVSNVLTTNSTGRSNIPINTQSRVITEISSKFILQIDSHPEANKVIGTRSMHLGDIIKMVGEFFNKQLITAEFSTDPGNTFLIDSNINQKVFELIQLALHLGVIIYVNPTEAISRKGLVGKQFRLNYLLSPYFRILSREYDRPVRLSEILSESSKTDQQKLLFN